MAGFFKLFKKGTKAAKAAAKRFLSKSKSKEKSNKALQKKLDRSQSIREAFKGSVVEGVKEKPHFPKPSRIQRQLDKEAGKRFEMGAEAARLRADDKARTKKASERRLKKRTK